MGSGQRIVIKTFNLPLIVNANEVSFSLIDTSNDSDSFSIHKHSKIIFCQYVKIIKTLCSTILSSLSSITKQCALINQSLQNNPRPFALCRLHFFCLIPFLSEITKEEHIFSSLYKHWHSLPSRRLVDHVLRLLCQNKCFVFSIFILNRCNTMMP